VGSALQQHFGAVLEVEIPNYMRQRRLGVVKMSASPLAVTAAGRRRSDAMQTGFVFLITAGMRNRALP
jgi:hypothetical protein